MRRSIPLLCVLLVTSSAWAVDLFRHDVCFPLGAGECTEISDLRITDDLEVGDDLDVAGDVTVTGTTTLATGSIDTTEILNGTITTTDISATAGITPGQIANLLRSVPLPIPGWLPCALEAGGIWDASGADAEPDLSNTPAGVVAIAYDDTGGSIDTETICASFVVPADYASGGTINARVTQDGATGANIETWSCAISVDGAAVGATNAAALVNQTAVQTATSTPAGTWAAGASIQVVCSQGNAAADDTVFLHAIEGRYTAVQ